MAEGILGRVSTDRCRLDQFETTNKDFPHAKKFHHKQVHNLVEIITIMGNLFFLDDLLK